MITVTIGNNVSRHPYIISSDTTIRDALVNEAQIDITRGVMHLDGATLGPGDLNKTFGELGYTGEPGHDRAFLMQVVKADNA